MVQGGCLNTNMAMTPEDMMEDLRKGTFERMDRAYEELRPILSEIMFTKIKYGEATKFVQSGKLIESLKHIKVIVEAHQYIRTHHLNSHKN